MVGSGRGGRWVGVGRGVGYISMCVLHLNVSTDFFEIHD